MRVTAYFGVLLGALIAAVQGQSNVTTISIDGKSLTLPLKLAFVDAVSCMKSPPDCYKNFPNYMEHILDTSSRLSALRLALDDINARPDLYYLHNLTVVPYNTFAEDKRSLDAVLNAAGREDVLGIFGLETKCMDEARLAAVYNKFVLAHACKVTRKGRPEEYSTFIQFYPSNEYYGRGVHLLLKQMNWKRAVVLIDQRASDNVEEGLLKPLQNDNDLDLTVLRFASFYAPQPQYYISSYAQIIADNYLSTRIFVFLPWSAANINEQNNVRTNYYFMTVMERAGLIQTGLFVVLGVWEEHWWSTREYLSPVYPRKNEFADFSLWDSSSYVAPHLTDAEQFLRQFFVLAYAPEAGTPEFLEFEDKINHVTMDQYTIYSEFGFPFAYPIGPRCKMENGRLDCPYKYRPMVKMVNLYDGVMLFAEVIQKMIENEENIFSGVAIYERMIRRKFKRVDGISQEIFDDGTISAIELLYQYIDKGDGTGFAMRPVAEVGYGDNSDQWGYTWLESNSTLRWIDGIPKDRPSCGFKGENCLYFKETLTIYVGSAFAGVLVIMLIFGGFLFRKLRYERALNGMGWKIERHELVLKRMREINSRSLNGSQMSASNMGSIASAGSVRQSHFDLRDWENAIKREAKKEKDANLRKQKGNKKQAFVDPMDARWLNLPDYSLAMYRGTLVSLKKIYKTHVDLTREVRKELKLIREVKHDNLLEIVGAIHEPPHVFLVGDVCLRGSLKEILENDEYGLDNMFVASIVNDILKGMIHLHGSQIGCHGRLKSSNCLVDARWVIRLSSFGLREFRQGEQEEEESDVQEGRGLLWTAPELLRAPDIYKPSVQELQKADAYSFGIILYEIIGRNGPFGDELLEPIDIVEQIKYAKGGEIFRPQTDLLDNPPENVVPTMKQCWAENPDVRPSFGHIKRSLKSLQAGLKANIFDNMMAMMEKYTNNLEGIVHERTKELDEERQKSERLLLMMLPKTVAETLKRGENVNADTYESVSIYFSDIVGFTSMSSESTPIQVVAFLNDLYTAFDSIIANYDVYKVETIGDAYMVVSGLPEKNGYNHAGEIASMSLNLLEAIKSFKIRHRPGDKLLLRIGIHSGPVVAGVVGLRMPRYCLFGDTVNTASRMESNGEPLKIHCSGQCRLLLEELGGYVVTERGYIAMKGKGEQLTYWVEGQDKEFRKERILKEAEKYPSLKKNFGMQ